MGYNHIIMKAYYIYVLKCSGGMLYTGFTNDLERRIVEHQEGKSKSFLLMTEDLLN